MLSHLRIDRDGDIAIVSLLAPTMPPPLFTELGETFAGFAREPALRAVILRGDAKVFSYGLDLRAAFAAWGPAFSGQGLAAARTELWTMIREIQAAITAVASCPAPVIAAIHGWCVGGGVDLITACDLRICTADARFSVRETKVAMVADLGSLQRLPLVIGDAATRELALTGKDIDAPRAPRERKCLRRMKKTANKSMLPVNPGGYFRSCYIAGPVVRQRPRYSLCQ